jgi:hypothetical protein
MHGISVLPFVHSKTNSTSDGVCVGQCMFTLHMMQTHGTAVPKSLQTIPIEGFQQII